MCCRPHICQQRVTENSPGFIEGIMMTTNEVATFASKVQKRWKPVDTAYRMQQ